MIGRAAGGALARNLMGGRRKSQQVLSDQQPQWSLKERVVH